MTPHSPPAQRLIAPLIAPTGRIALALGSRTRWREASGYLFAPIELPGGEPLPDETAGIAIARLARQWFGCDATLLPSPQMYGPSAKHAIDRLTPAPDDEPTPLLRLERMAPKEQNQSEPGVTTDPVRRIIVQVYLAQARSEPAPTSETAGLCWLTPHALRLAIRGAPLADLLALTEHVVLHDSPSQPLTPDERARLMIYMPSEYGERHLLRIEAKYGARALWPPPPSPSGKGAGG